MSPERQYVTSGAQSAREACTWFWIAIAAAAPLPAIRSCTSPPAVRKTPLNSHNPRGRSVFPVHALRGRFPRRLCGRPARDREYRVAGGLQRSPAARRVILFVA